MSVAVESLFRLERQWMHLDGGGFVAGTLVHTKNGLVPIEQIRVGDLVLSQPESKGELAYKRVVNTFVHDDKEIYLVEYCVTNTPFNSHEGFHYEEFWREEEKLPRGYLVATGNHPFWVKGVGWTGVEFLPEHIAGTNILETKDGRSVVVLNVRKIFKTEASGVGWTYERNEAYGPTIDLRDNLVIIGTKEVLDPYLVSPPDNFQANRDIARRVYNFEVEGFHTYYVGEDGVWVHNTGYPADPACFVTGTPVHTKDGIWDIEHIEVGTLVLSRCEKTGVIDYRPVTNTFYHRVSTLCALDFIFDDGCRSTIDTTPEHPFWVQDIGWRPAGQLQSGDRLFIYNDFDKTNIRETVFDRNWVAPPKDPNGASLVTVLKSTLEKTRSHTGTEGVYNFEVADFHTYFVDDCGLWVHDTNRLL